MSKAESSELKRRFEERSWQPLFLAAHSQRLLAAEAEAIPALLAWLEQSGEELLADIQSVATFFPGALPAFDLADLRVRAASANNQSEAMADIGRELAALDTAIRATDQRAAEFIPDELFFGDVSMEELIDHALATLDRKHPNPPVLAVVGRQ